MLPQSTQNSRTTPNRSSITPMIAISSGLGRLQPSQNVDYLTRVLAEVDVDALHADGARAVYNHKAHLPHAAHHAHGLIRLGQHVILARPSELPVEQHRQADMRNLLQLHRGVRRIAVDDVHVRLLAQRVRGFLQLT